MIRPYCVSKQHPKRAGQLRRTVFSSQLPEANQIFDVAMFRIVLFSFASPNDRGIVMITSQRNLKNRALILALAICTPVLAVSFGALPAAAQGQSDRDQDSVTVQQSDGQQGPYGPDRNADSGNQVVPPSITLPAGSVIPVRVNEWLSSDKNQSGDRFSATLEQPLVANGWVVAVRGQVVTGRIAVAKKAPRGGGASELGVELSELILVDGQVLPVRTQLLQSSAGTSTGRNAAAVATTTGVGAVIGGAAEGGEGAAVGAVIGATAGIIGVMSTRGKPTVIAPESMLTFRLEEPLPISTEQSQMAFQPVRPSDYRGDQDAYSNPREQRVRSGPPYPPPYYYAGPWYGYGYGYGFYPGIYFGYSGFYGPRFRGGFGGGFRGGRGGFRR